VIVPPIDGWTTQWYWKVPAELNLNENDPDDRVPESHSPPLAVVECVPDVNTQVTVSPTVIVRLTGEN
jgi:hypothetical protein